MTRPGIAAGLVGIGVAVVVVIAFELVFAIQAVVFLLALPVGLLIGWYAVERERRTVAVGGRIGWPASLANGAIAGLITGLSLAVLYVAIRLLFLYLDDGFRAGGTAYPCTSGPDCSYQRALDQPTVAQALGEAGVHDTAGYTSYFLQGQAAGGASLVVLVLIGSVLGAAAHRSGSRGAASSTILAEGPR